MWLCRCHAVWHSERYRRCRSQPLCLELVHSTTLKILKSIANRVGCVHEELRGWQNQGKMEVTAPVAAVNIHQLLDKLAYIRLSRNTWRKRSAGRVVSRRLAGGLDSAGHYSSVPSKCESFGTSNFSPCVQKWKRNRGYIKPNRTFRGWQNDANVKPIEFLTWSLPNAITVLPHLTLCLYICCLVIKYKLRLMKALRIEY